MTPREQAKSRTGGLCAIPGCTATAVHLHHRKLQKQGGSDDVENMIPVCSQHHSWVHANPAMSYAAGYLLHSWEPEDAWRDGWYK